jgi:hypothetical protein
VFVVGKPNCLPLGRRLHGIYSVGRWGPVPVWNAEVRRRRLRSSRLCPSAWRRLHRHG